MMTTYAACLIVRNESNTFAHLFESLNPWVDEWIIIDTGSTDATVSVIVDLFKKEGVSFRLKRRPWVHFGHNRNELLDYARAVGESDLLLLPDADQTWTVKSLPDDLASVYYGTHSFMKSGMEWQRVDVIPRISTCRYVGDAHSVIDHADYPAERTTLIVTERRAGGRGDPAKFHRDVTSLSFRVERDPSDTRSWFYLGRSYMDLSQYSNARTAFRERVLLGGWAEEAWYAQYEIGNAYAAEKDGRCGREWALAYVMRPWRPEPFVKLCNWFHNQGAFNTVSTLLQLGAVEDDEWFKDDILFVDRDTLTYLKNIRAYYLGKDYS